MADANRILWTVGEVAAHLGVPESAVRKAAEQHGYLIRVGRAVRVKSTEIEDLVERCRNEPEKPALPSGSGRDATPSMSSATSSKPAAAQKSAPALQIAAGLKRRLPNTSAAKPGAVVPLRRPK